ncbi:hypothetical protein AVEN_155930-1 [Araneus ventricosus]|uniref:Uncharacterized protein n=1 Tax=Araneus ventricosus TaxID=182803 RepID=A0A4Y2NTB9_ARAVE|nr:hypothetical protein AVEN_155930-1 [Araneus ventricosus]
MRRSPGLPGYYRKETGPKSHTTITSPTGEARTRLLIRQLLIRELEVPPVVVRIKLKQKLNIVISWMRSFFTNVTKLSYVNHATYEEFSRVTNSITNQLPKVTKYNF